MKVNLPQGIARWLVVCVVFAAIGYPAVAQEGSALDRARAALQEKKWEDARSLATEFISTDPASAEAHRIRGWALYRLQQYPEALGDFAAALRIDPHDEDAALGSGRCHRLLNQYDAAVADFTLAHELAPTSARPLCERGAILILQKKLDASLADYVAAEKLDPAYHGLYSYFAEVYLYRREPAKALAAVREGEKREPDLVIYRVNEAHSYLFLGEIAKAKTIYLANKNAVEADKNITFAQIVLNDFRLMRAAGVTTPGMDEIEAAMRAP